MKEKNITVVMVEPKKAPTVTILKNDLDSLQRAVSIGADYQGLIELISLEAGVDLLCNEEGKILGLEGNRRVGRDIIVGVFYVVGVSPDGDLASLPQEKIAQYMERFKNPENYSRSDVECALFMRVF